MAQITVSISDDLERDLRKFADENGYATLSALVSEAIRDKMRSNGPEYWQRVGMVLQLRNNQLLETLIGDKELVEGKDWHMNTMHDVLTNGYQIEYPSIFEHIERDEMSNDVARSVYDILDVYRDLQWAARELSDEELVREVAFPGFDGNNDHERLGYARHLVKNGRWESLATHDTIPNSHGAEPHYEAMVERHKEVRSRKRGESHDHKVLTRSEVNYIMNGYR
jgi:uncharacterized protein YfbU (UPF0304 family)